MAWDGDPKAGRAAVKNESMSDLDTLRARKPEIASIAAKHGAGNARACLDPWRGARLGPIAMWIY